ncbi:modification methylase, HemK family [Pseudarthrobacter chlorophenolicus A6]|uniref:peptide chain release factor N(5)-glutamine methyltransferase n=1 Tax=Pseudarthrobacter chlorophenolicus (strain ATCC 700700 / DSM 12829 / CIP 107037 / JCM 12360 / KCTC 9906 / NCIMB 13794 / A6) TaxID=452863 RepID=B8HAM0_PSECP|nr:modification methylase, HemK family [Pseudarthrobacter chlorophenolicus A6]
MADALRAAGCVFAEEEALLLLEHAVSPDELADCVRRRVAGLPLEYILGWAEFDGHRMAVRPGVFVPRRRTELLVRLAAGLMSGEGNLLKGVFPADSTFAGAAAVQGSLRSASFDGVVVDLCCGSGAVGAALARRFPRAELHAVDIDSVAVECARSNVEAVGGHVHTGDLFDALPCSLRSRVHILAVNAPYVPTEAIKTMPPEARVHEPLLSLDGGTDGLDFHRRVAAGAKDWLAPHGCVLIETSEQQAGGTAALMAATGLSVTTVRSEDLDATVVVGSAHK